MQKKVALVTGASQGIGLGIAQGLARENCDIVIADIKKEKDAAEALEGLISLGADVLYVQADISRTREHAKILKTIAKDFGRLDVLVNNAGVSPKVREDVLQASEKSFDRLLTVNLRGPYFLTKACANWMIKQKKADADFKGCIINISSVSSFMASVNRGDYCLSKAAVSMATKLWAVRLAEHAIPVYEVQPGIIRTAMTAGVKDKYDKMIKEGLMLQSRWGLPEDVGKAAAMLVRGDLAYSTGQVIRVDGGMSVERL